MISRLTTLAAIFSVLATASLTYAASAQHEATVAASSASKPVRVVQLQRVVVTAKRIDSDPR
jgi:hypothetical protein